jgi:hypothetical protein
MTEPENFDDELFADLYVRFADGIAKGGTDNTQLQRRRASRQSGTRP